jgi:protein gp37
LRQVKCKWHIASFEPLYEDLSDVKLEGIDWVIIGAQTRPNLQPNEEWVYKLSSQASALGIPVFWKDNLKVTKGVRKEFPK